MGQIEDDAKIAISFPEVLCPKHGEHYIIFCRECRDCARLRYAILPDMLEKSRNKNKKGGDKKNVSN